MNKTIALVIDPALVLWVDASAARQDVPLQELVSNSERYHSRQVFTEGAHATGFETNALGAFVRRDGAAVYVAEPVIWLQRSRDSVQHGLR